VAAAPAAAAAAAVRVGLAAAEKLRWDEEPGPADRLLVIARALSACVEGWVVTQDAEAPSWFVVAAKTRRLPEAVEILPW